MTNTTNSGGSEMPVVLEKARLNVWNVGAAVVGIMVTAFGWGVTYSSLQAKVESIKMEIARNEQNRQERTVAADQSFKEIQTQLPQIQQLNNRIDRTIEITQENRQALDRTNSRIDGIVEGFGSKLDTIGENINKLTTRVEVIATQYERNETRLATPPPQLGAGR